MSSDLQAIIEKAWDERDAITIGTGGEVRAAVVEALNLLDSGARRVAEKVDGDWQVNQWLKKAVLLSFRLTDMETIPGGPGGAHWWD
ncbi:MAG: 2,3,4,5-tetrahydropyridine-2,6-dicarboxylate N-succinyltransferase, partial [Sphingomonadales bacterium]